MKILNIRNFTILFFLMLGLNACEEEIDELYVGDPTILFNVANEDELYAPANVYITNASKFGESYEWKFTGGDVVVDGEMTGSETYFNVEPDYVHFPIPGQYEITLKVTANGETKEYKKTITVLKPQPKIFTDPVGILYGEDVRFYSTIFKYPGEEDKVTYEWDFGDGTAKVTDEEPVHAFAAYGDYTVTLTVNDGYETLTTTKVITAKKAVVRSLYVTDVLTGKLYRKMLYSDVDDEPRVQLPTSVGMHPLSVNVYKERVIISDAGDHIKYSSWGTDADGRIFSVNLLGEDEYTITSGTDLNGSGNEYVNDPFVSTVDEDGNIYWVDRYQGVRRMNYVEQNAAYPTSPDGIFATLLASDIDESSTWGWTDGGLKIVDGELWYSKHGTGKGLYKFSLEDGSFIAKIDDLADFKIRSFDVDLANGKIYFVIGMPSNGEEEGFYVCNIDGSGLQQLDNFMEGGAEVMLSREGGANERTSITSVVVDNESGYVYYPFRHKDDIDDLGGVIGDGSKSGIKRYKLDGTGSAEWYFKGVIPYGIGLDPELR